MSVFVCMCVRLCVCVCVCMYVRVCVRARARAHEHAPTSTIEKYICPLKQGAIFHRHGHLRGRHGLHNTVLFQ